MSLETISLENIVIVIYLKYIILILLGIKIQLSEGSLRLQAPPLFFLI